MRIALLAVAVAGALAACGGDSAEAPARAARALHLVTVGHFSSPVWVTAPPGDRRRLFVVEQGGVIRVVRGGRTLRTPFLDLRSKVVSGGEQGLLSMAFAPDYARTGRFYVYYTDNGGNERLAEYRRASADRANPGSARQLLFQPDSESNHNGGSLVFGPDHLLYVGLGDGGGANDQHGGRGNAQNLGTWLGKILRFDPRASGGRAYRVPSSNPFVGRAGARPEIYAYGLRNPWRFSFDRRTGDIAIGDVGQDAVEEIDFLRRGRARGRNFGWRPWEGRRRNFGDEAAPGAVFPVLQELHSQGNCSITGGYVVRDRAVPVLYGRYVYGDYCKGRLIVATLRANGARNKRALAFHVPQLSSFGEDARGRVYVVSLGGAVYRFAQ